MRGRCVAALLTLGLAFAPAGDAGAVLSERGGTGVWELQSAESKRAGRLELGFFGSYKRFGLGDPSGTRLNGLRGGANAAFGLAGGFELSGTIPVYGYYTSTGTGSGIPVESISARLGDVSSRLRWTGPFILPGLRLGLEGDVLFATGDDRVESYPGRGAVRPYTNRENNYTGRAMLTWDATRAGTAAPIRLHANGAYTFQGDESRYGLPQVLLPLPAPAPARNRDNDFLTLGGAMEVDLPRVTLFGEAVTDQFVNERGTFAGRENRMFVTPGIRFWLPGGAALTGAYSFDISKDDGRTAFKPREAWAKNEWRVAFSLGTVYRRAGSGPAVAAAVSEPLPAVTAQRPAPQPGPPAPADPAPARVAARDTATTARASATVPSRRERRDVQEDSPVPTKAAAAPSAVVAPADTPGVASPTGGAVSPAMRPASPAPAASGLRDTDGDGIPDDRDGCPLQAEDWDGFQDLDGCPDLDNDQDGIPDVRDQCPNDPETYNGYYDFDGCPDEVAPRWIGARDAAPEPGPRAALRAPAATDTLRGPGAPARAAVAPTVTGGAARAMAAPPAAATMGTAVPPVAGVSAASPAATAPTAAAPSPLADSLRLQLEFERARREDLQARLERSETERQQAVGMLGEVRRTAAASTARETVQVPRPVAAAPAATTPAAPRVASTSASGSAAATAVMAEENQRRLRDLEIANAELRGRIESYERGRSVTTQTPASPVVVSSPRIEPAASSPAAVGGPAPGGTNAAAERLAVLEAEMAQLRNQPVPAGARDTSATLILQRLARIQASMDSLRNAEPVPVPVEPAGTDPGAVSELDAMLPLGRARVYPEVRFAPGGTALAAEAGAVLERLATALVRVPGAQIRVIGHTDDSGGAADNLRLSRDRAVSVAEDLFARGVARAQVAVEGRGEEAPVASNATAAGRQANRRVEFVRVK